MSESSLFKFKSGAVVALVLFVLFDLLDSLLEGKVVAKLPFKPLMKMSHRGLQGDVPTDCSMAFLYFPSNAPLAFGPICRSFGDSHRRGASAGLFPMPDPKTNLSDSRTVPVFF